MLINIESKKNRLEFILDKIAKDTDRNYFMSAKEAKDYGIIDEVIIQSPTPKKGKK
jgi:ATP-dependent protease ClpP protease subunit